MSVNDKYPEAMTPQQETHLKSITKRFTELCDTKYRKGQQEHGGDMWRMSPGELIDNAISEAIDQVVYLLTLKDRLSGLPRFDGELNDFNRNRR